MTKARGSSWLTPAPVDPLSCVGYLENLVGQGVVASRPAIRLTWHATNFPSLIHLAVRIHHHLPPSPSLVSRTALPFRLAANNTRNNTRSSTHLVFINVFLTGVCVYQACPRAHDTHAWSMRLHSTAYVSSVQWGFAWIEANEQAYTFLRVCKVSCACGWLRRVVNF